MTKWRKDTIKDTQILFPKSLWGNHPWEMMMVSIWERSSKHAMKWLQPYHNCFLHYILWYDPTHGNPILILVRNPKWSTNDTSIMNTILQIYNVDLINKVNGRNHLSYIDFEPIFPWKTIQITKPITHAFKLDHYKQVVHESFVTVK